MTSQKDFDSTLAAKRATPEYHAAMKAYALAHKLGRQVRAARETRGWTHTELARRAGPKPHAISRLEAGDVVSILTTLEMIAAALDRDVLLFRSSRSRRSGVPADDHIGTVHVQKMKPVEPTKNRMADSRIRDSVGCEGRCWVRSFW
jgi:ribosome-binding protein aMBF1 (putative translation factor)